MTVQIIGRPLKIEIIISPRTKALLERFDRILNAKGIKLTQEDDQIYYGLHLALTYIQIKNFKAELQKLKKNKTV